MRWRVASWACNWGEGQMEWGHVTHNLANYEDSQYMVKTAITYNIHAYDTKSIQTAQEYYNFKKFI